MAKTRQPAVAGMFYPAGRHQLAATVERLLDAGAARLANHPPPLRPPALVAPHAGYPYSGPIAGSAFAALRAPGPTLTRAVVIGPSHHIAFHGIAVPAADAFATPLGPVAVDRPALDHLRRLPWVTESDRIHAPEHALEVELPFLTTVAGPDLLLVPLVVGEASAAEVADTLEPFLDDPATVVVVSSDLSHYLPHPEATALDAETARLVTTLAGPRLTAERACGFRALRGLLELARRRSLLPALLDLRNSGDTAGPRDRVVGYGAFSVAP